MTLVYLIRLFQQFQNFHKNLLRHLLTLWNLFFIMHPKPSGDSFEFVKFGCVGVPLLDFYEPSFLTGNGRIGYLWGAGLGHRVRSPEAPFPTLLWLLVIVMIRENTRFFSPGKNRTAFISRPLSGAKGLGVSSIQFILCLVPCVSLKWVSHQLS